MITYHIVRSEMHALKRGVCACVCACATSAVAPQVQLSFFGFCFETGSLVGLNLTKQAATIGKRAPGIQLCRG